MISKITTLTFQFPPHLTKLTPYLRKLAIQEGHHIPAEVLRSSSTFSAREPLGISGTWFYKPDVFITISIKAK